MKTLGERLRYYRLKAGYKQNEAAEKLGLNNAPALSNYERNFRLPDIDFLKKAALSYGVSLDILTGLSECQEIKKLEYIKTFQKRLKYLRNDLGYSHETLAAKVGLDEDTIKDFENGIIDLPSEEIIVKLAEALACTPDFLVGKVEERHVFEDGTRLPVDLSRFINENLVEINGVKLEESDKRMLLLSLQAVFYDASKQKHMAENSK